jgi:hypothetical protein
LFALVVPELLDRYSIAPLVVPELSAAEPLATVEVEASVGLVEVGAVLDLGAVRQLLGDKAGAPLDEQGQGYAVNGVTAALKERNEMI